ncbi:MAG: PilZ domain-containing protein [Terriglobales bacterium]
MDLQILLVCPDQEPAMLLKAILSEMRMEVEYTASIARGMELLDEHQFDAIVIDYRGDPASNEFLEHLCKSHKNRSTMLIAVVDAEYNPRPIFGLGANFVLYRPLTSERTRLSLHAARSLMRRERRRSARTGVISTAKVSYAGAADVNVTMVDISKHGTLITTRNGLPDARKVYFEFALPGQKEVVRLAGEVAWQDFSGRTGVRFVDVPQASKRLIQGWLEQYGPAPNAELEPSRERESEPQPAREPELETQIITTPISLEEHSEESDEQPDTAGPDETNENNRRKGERLSCKVGAEVYCAGISIPNRCSLSDISEGGCYVEMPSPFPARSAVEIVIRTGDMKFRLKGQVLSSHPGFGMGVRFNFRDPAERQEILKLLALVSSDGTHAEQSEQSD